MINELWHSVEKLDEEDIKTMIIKIENQGAEVSLEDRIKLYFGLLKINYIDNALFQMQIIYNEIKYKGLNNEFIAKHPDLKIHLMAKYKIWEDACGNIHVDDENNECDECCDGCSYCCGCFGILFCITLCCGPQGLECVFSPIDPDAGWCCNCQDGGFCCNNCCSECCLNFCDDQCCPGINS